MAVSPQKGVWLQRLAGKVDIVNLMASGLLRVLA
jgi:hypothetical protein